LAAPAGPCEWCGGPQLWTTVRGIIYVRCAGGCLPLPLAGMVPADEGYVSGREAEAVDSAPAGSLQDARDLAEREDDDLPF